MIQPGLERIGALLKDVKFPWKAIHVAGTNGKGSICHYASALLTRSNIRNGRFTSPHLIDRWDCIAIDGSPISKELFHKHEDQVITLDKKERIGASEFELLTATAFHIFNDQRIDVGVVEVGMGGKLDATNVLNNQIISVISKIARDHQNFLGNTLEEITAHKAGILRPKVAYVVNPVNESNVFDVVEKVATEIGAGPRLHADTEELRNELYKSSYWEEFTRQLLPSQRDNAMLAYLAFRQALQSLGKPNIKAGELFQGINNQQFRGRLHRVSVPTIFGASTERDILIDGAHNEDAALVLNEYMQKRMQGKDRRLDGSPGVEKGHKSRTIWVMAMSEGKDARSLLQILLREGDYVVTTTFDPVDGMPWVKPMDPEELLRTALQTVSAITGLVSAEPSVHRALLTAKYLANEGDEIVVTGSLYLAGSFYREEALLKEDPTALDIPALDKAARGRASRFLSRQSEDRGVSNALEKE